MGAAGLMFHNAVKFVAKQCLRQHQGTAAHPHAGLTLKPVTGLKLKAVMSLKLKPVMGNSA